MYLPGLPLILKQEFCYKDSKQKFHTKNNCRNYNLSHRLTHTHKFFAAIAMQNDRPNFLFILIFSHTPFFSAFWKSIQGVKTRVLGNIWCCVRISDICRPQMSHFCSDFCRYSGEKKKLPRFRSQEISRQKEDRQKRAVFSWSPAKEPASGQTSVRTLSGVQIHSLMLFK